MSIDKPKTPYVAFELKVPDSDEESRQRGTIDLRIVVLRRGHSAFANRTDYPFVAVEACEGKDALGAPVWRPSTLISESIAAAIVFKLEEEARLAAHRAATVRIGG